eukprot:7391948-Prymnesium_polylepis.1
MVIVEEISRLGAPRYRGASGSKATAGSVSSSDIGAKPATPRTSFERSGRSMCILTIRRAHNTYLLTRGQQHVRKHRRPTIPPLLLPVYPPRTIHVVYHVEATNGGR